MYRSSLLICDQAILQLYRKVAYFCAVRLSYCYEEKLTISAQLGYPIKIKGNCLFLYEQGILYQVEKQPISVQIWYAVVMQLSYPIATQRSCLFSVRLGYPIATQRGCLFLCIWAILRLLREVSYFSSIRLSNSYLEMMPISVRLGYPIATKRGCQFLSDQAIPQLLREVAFFGATKVSYSQLERQPISVR